MIIYEKYIYNKFHRYRIIEDEANLAGKNNGNEKLDFQKYPRLRFISKQDPQVKKYTLRFENMGKEEGERIKMKQKPER